MYDLYGALIGNLSNYLYTYILIILLVAGGIYFTVRTKFVQFRYLKESLRVVLAPSEDDKAISSFQHDKRMNDCLPPILFSAIFKLLKVLPDTELDAC